MTDREKLIAIIKDCRTYVAKTEELADHLLSNGVTIQSWIPVSERLPDLELVEVRVEDMDLFACLVVKTNPLYPQKRYITKAWYDGEGFMDTDCIWITKSVTHWMPLPSPPKEENK